MDDRVAVALGAEIDQACRLSRAQRVSGCAGPRIRRGTIRVENHTTAATAAWLRISAPSAPPDVVHSTVLATEPSRAAATPSVNTGAHCRTYSHDEAHLRACGQHCGNHAGPPRRDQHRPGDRLVPVLASHQQHTDDHREEVAMP